MKRVRSKAAAGHMRPTKSCLKTGIEPRATGPRTLSSMGTSRQPMTFWLWWRTAVSSVRISAAQDLDAHRDDLVRRSTAEVGDEAQATRVPFERRVVQAACGRKRHNQGIM